MVRPKLTAATAAAAPATNTLEEEQEEDGVGVRHVCDVQGVKRSRRAVVRAIGERDKGVVDGRSGVR